MSKEKDNIIKCTVKIKRVVYYKEDWGVVALNLESKIYGEVPSGSFTVKGVMNKPDTKETYTIVAKEVLNEKYGKQFDLIYMGIAGDISNPEGQRIFLRKILTGKQVENIYKTFDNPVSIIKTGDIGALTKVNGIGIKKAIALVNKYKEHVDYSHAYVELDRFGLTQNAIRKIVDFIGSPELAVEYVTKNPYFLIGKVEGMGWKRADDIALSSGIHPHSPERISAFIKHFLNEKALEGDSYISPSYLMDGIMEHIGEELEDEQLSKVIYEMYEDKYNDEGELVRERILWWDEEKTKIGLHKFFKLEYQIAEELLRLKSGFNDMDYTGWEDKVKELEYKQGWEFTKQQRDGIKTVLENQVVVVTGLGGSGKSSVVAGMLKVLSNREFSQCALSGRAAARLTEVTGEEGMTIHRLLGYRGEFCYNKENQLSDDIIIVDEISMIGGQLFYSLLQAVKTGAKLILIGDTGQLPSIGVLNVASDIINSNEIPIVNLTEIHRQAAKSAIITDSINIRKGLQIIPEDFSGKINRGEMEDLELDIYINRANTGKKIVEKFQENLGKVESIFDIQVILPMRTRGTASTFEINKTLQDICNPFHPAKRQIELSYSKDLKYVLRVGDKVMNTRNNYKTYFYSDDDCILTPIFNGDLGIIVEIGNDDLVVNFNRTGEVIIPKEHRKYVELGYACTCHKFQGSEAKIVIVGLDYSSYMMLNREWVYTAITRAKEYCVLCAEGKALRHASTKTIVPHKKTHLKHILQNFSTYSKQFSENKRDKEFFF